MDFYQFLGIALFALAIAGATFASTKNANAKAAFTGLLWGGAVGAYLSLAFWLAIGAP